MKPWTRMGAATGVVIGLLLGAATAHGTTSTAGHLRYAIDTWARFSDLPRTAQRHDYVILHAWQQAKMREIKAVDPTTKVLVYKNLTSSKVTTNPSGLSAHGVPYEQADSEHPEWFLLNTSGERFTFTSYRSSWAMDVGSPSYQKRWADNVIAELESEGWDGVFMDNVDTSMKWNYPVAEVAKYPTDAAWQQATESALSHIAPRIRGEGKLVIPNIGSWGSHQAVGRSWLQYVDGAMQENFAKWDTSPGTGYAPESRWEGDLGSLKYSQQAGKDYLAVTHSANDDSDAALYGWASVLLGAQGKAHFALHGDYTNETWFPEYDYEVGEPIGPESRDPTGIHRRQFTNGIVVVNPTSGQRSTDLPSTYSGSGRSNVTSVTLAANTAAILTRDIDNSGGSAEDAQPGSGDTGGEPAAPPPGTGPGAGGGDGGTNGGRTNDTTDGAAGTTGDATVAPGSRKVKKGKIVAKGTIKAASGEPVLASERTGSDKRFEGTTISLAVTRRGGGSQAKDVKVRDGGRFVGRLRVCRPGRYKLSVHSPSSSVQRWPGSLRVRRSHLRCG